MPATPTQCTRYCLTQWISKLLESFEIHWGIHYIVNVVLFGIEDLEIYARPVNIFPNFWHCNSMVSCQKGPTRHAYAWQIGPFWQDTMELWYMYLVISNLKCVLRSGWYLTKKNYITCFYAGNPFPCTNEQLCKKCVHVLTSSWH